MKQSELGRRGGCTFWLFPPLLIILLAAWAPYHRPASQLRLSVLEREKLVTELRDYGLRRERQDRETFPAHMPKAGEPYDLVTGNVIR